MRSKNLMANLRRSTKDFGVGGGRSKPDERCKRHPKHRQSPGVCSLCLAEKLSQLSAHSRSRRRRNYTTTAVASSSSSSLSSCYSSSVSSASSSSSSPMHRYGFNADGKGTSFSLFLFNSGKNILTKSRSVVFASRMRSKDGNYDDDHKKKKGGLLAKLLHPRRNKRKEEDTGLVHSKSMREIFTIEVH